MEPTESSSSEPASVAPQASPQIAEKLKVAKEKAFKEFKLPKIHFGASGGSWGTRIRNKFKEYVRVLKITKKPDANEYKVIVKASGIGLVIIGVIGFVISIIAQLVMQ